MGQKRRMPCRRTDSLFLASWWVIVEPVKDDDTVLAYGMGYLPSLQIIFVNHNELIVNENEL